MTATQRVLEVLNYKGIRKTNFYKQLGFGNGFLDKNRSIGSDKLEKISDHFDDISPVWLFTGKGSMLREEEQARVISADIGKGVPILPIDALGGIAAGDTDGFNLDKIQERYHIPLFREQKVDFMIPIRGDSMSPRFNNGDVVACRILHEPSFIQWGKPHIISTREQGVVCKYLFESDHRDQYVCRSENQSRNPDFRIPKDTIYNISIIIGTIRLE